MYRLAKSEGLSDQVAVDVDKIHHPWCQADSPPSSDICSIYRCELSGYAAWKEKRNDDWHRGATNLLWNHDHESQTTDGRVVARVLVAMMP